MSNVKFRLATVLFLLLMPILNLTAGDTATPLQYLYMMKEIVPNAKTVGIIKNNNDANTQDLIKQIQRAAATAQVKVVIAEINDMKGISQKFKELINTYNVDALWIYADDDLVSTKVVSEFLIKNCVLNKIPLIAPSEKWINSGACYTLTRENDRVKILINKKTADALSLTVPEKYLDSTKFLAAN